MRLSLLLSWGVTVQCQSTHSQYGELQRVDAQYTCRYLLFSSLHPFCRLITELFFPLRNPGPGPHPQTSGMNTWPRLPRPEDTYHCKQELAQTRLCGHVKLSTFSFLLQDCWPGHPLPWVAGGEPSESSAFGHRHEYWAKGWTPLSPWILLSQKPPTTITGLIRHMN